MRTILFAISILSFFNVTGQKKKILNKVAADLQKESSQWYHGNALLKDDELTKVQGLFQFNDKTRVLTFKGEEEAEILLPSKVVKFDFFDEEIQKKRSFISIDYPIVEDFKKDGKLLYYSLNEIYNQKTVPLFFEVIRETKKFVVLSKTTAINHIVTRKSVSVGVYPYNAIAPNNTQNELLQGITLFFLSTTRDLFLFSRDTRVETKTSTKKAKNNYQKNVRLGDVLLPKMMGIYFPHVEGYISANKLDWNKIEDLTKIIDYYKQLEGE